MAEQKLNEVIIDNQKPFIAYLYLDKQVIGGSDALNFTSKLDELKQKMIRYLIVDLSNVTIMNSTGLGMLVGGLVTLKKYDVEMILTSIPDKIQNLLNTTHLNSVFKSHVSLEEAINTLV